jgi:putative phage-type endonuclease
MISKELANKLTNCKVFSTVKQEDDEAAWLAARTRGIGGSDVGAICGVSPFTSARQIYLNKTGQYDEGLKPSDAAKERMHFGHMLEPIVADEFARRELTGDFEGFTLVDIDATMQHKDHSWALANVDRLILDRDGNPWGILECKTTSEYMNDEWESGEILMSYMYQLNWYMWILGIERGCFACLVGGNKFYSYTVFRNDELLNETIIPAAKSFWFDNVLALKEPEMQATDTEFANGLYSTVVKNSEIFFEDDETNKLAETVFECKSKIKELTGIMEEAQNRLKDRLKDNEIGYCKDYTVKWSPRCQSRIDSDKLKRDYPEVYMSCQKKIEFRAMTVKGV